MRMQAIALLGVLGLLLFAFPGRVRAAESYANCTGMVTAVPADITTAGVWCLKQNLTTALSENSNGGPIVAIFISNGVILDCNGFTLSGTAGSSTAAIGIQLQGTSMSVRHCDVQGFKIGLQTNDDPTSVVIEDNSFEGNWSTGISAGGHGVVVRRNRVLNTGGSTLDGSARGIYVPDNSQVDVMGQHCRRRCRHARQQRQCLRHRSEVPERR